PIPRPDLVASGRRRGLAHVSPTGLSTRSARWQTYRVKDASRRTSGPSPARGTWCNGHRGSSNRRAAGSAVGSSKHASHDGASGVSSQMPSPWFRRRFVQALVDCALLGFHGEPVTLCDRVSDRGPSKPPLSLVTPGGTSGMFPVCGYWRLPSPREHVT